jgi:hypothetical protein
MSLYFRAYCAAFCADVTDALSWRSWLVKRMRTSNGSAIVPVWVLLLDVLKMKAASFAMKDLGLWSSAEKAAGAS